MEISFQCALGLQRRESTVDIDGIDAYGHRWMLPMTATTYRSGVIQPSITLYDGTVLFRCLLRRPSYLSYGDFYRQQESCSQRCSIPPTDRGHPIFRRPSASGSSSAR